MKRTIQDPGFGSQYGKRTKRIINEDGSFNVTRSGIRSGWHNIYHEFIEMRTLPFLLVIISIFVLLNLAFASIYFFIGVEHLSMERNGNLLDDFIKCFFFSTQTFTTVGYGAISPIGRMANIVASFEAMTGLLSFALATGLIWGKFSRPSSRLLFSKNALIAPFKEGASLQCRLVNERKNVLLEMEAKLVLVTTSKIGEEYQRQYFQLPLQIAKVNFLPLSWTIVHPIDENSPIADWNQQDFEDKDAEILVMISGFDDTFSQVVHARYSYTWRELKHGLKFKRVFTTDDEGHVQMNIHDIHELEEIESHN